MATCDDYLSWRGDLSFEQDKINEIDMVLIALLPLLDLEGFESETFSNVMKKYVDPKFGKKQTMGLLIPANITEMVVKISKLPRYRDILLADYVNKVDVSMEMQFSAVTLTYKDLYTLVVFSGTDDTIIGWKENFNSIYENYSNASKYATDYLDNVAKTAKGDLIVFGHSKGGNLTTVSTLFCKQETYDRISKSIAFDGQGINEVNDLTPAQIERFCHIHKVLPESSVVGRTYNHLGTFEIVNSSNKGLYQHDPTSWEVMGPSFIHCDKFSASSDEIKNLVDDTLFGLSMDERRRFVSVIYNTFENAGIATLFDLEKNFKNFLVAISKTSKEDVATVNKVIRVLAKDRALMEYAVDCMIQTQKVKSKR